MSDRYCCDPDEHFFPDPSELGYDEEAFPAECGNCTGCEMTWAEFKASTMEQPVEMLVPSLDELSLAGTERDRA